MPISSPPTTSRIFRLFIVLTAAFCGVAATPLTGAAAQGRPETPVMVPRHIYSATANPQVEIKAALVKARSQHKRVLLDFGGDWCGDCQVLEIYFREPVNAVLMNRHYVLVHVWIGQMDHNIQLAARYGVPIAKGVPALAVLAADGRAIYSQRTGQFNDMRHMNSSSVTAFLNKWKG